jgi:hypothetical protein
MIYHEKLKNLWKVASKEDASRYSIHDIMMDVDKKVIVATDGHAMTMLSIDGLIEDGEKSFMIPIEALKTAQTMYNRVARGLGLKVYIRANEEEIIVSRLSTKNARIFDRPMGTYYPQWNAIIAPPEKYAAKLTIDAELLSRLSLALNGDDLCSGVILYVTDDPEKQIYVTVNRTDSLGTIMPMRLETTNPPSRFWEKEGK